MIRSHRSRWSLLAVAALVASLLMAVPTAGAESPSPEDAEEQQQTRIIGGGEAIPNFYDFAVALIQDGSGTPGTGNAPWYSQFCGGSLIHAKWVLTAAHCVTSSWNDDPSEVDVLIGRHDIFAGTEGVLMNVASIYVHEDYDTSDVVHDIALLELVASVDFNLYPTAGTIDLAFESQSSVYEPGDKVTVAGYGETCNPSASCYPDELYAVSVDVISDADCASAFGGTFRSLSRAAGFSMICAGIWPTMEKDSCQGDSGGPLFVEAGDSGTGDELLVGVVSWGGSNFDPCAAPGYPGVYARVPTYTSWIEQTTGLDFGNGGGATPTCDGLEATHVGTEDDDFIKGTNGDDVFVMLGGNDTAVGKGGNDVFCMGEGDDVAKGGPGDDIIYGEEGDDRLIGAGGNDIIHGGDGNDELLGRLGRDDLFGDDGSDTLKGANGGDSMSGGRGGDWLEGGGGPDAMWGDGGNDVLFGGDQKDDLFGGGADDDLYGEGASDYLNGGPGPDFAHGGGAMDECEKADTYKSCETIRSSSKIGGR